MHLGKLVMWLASGGLERVVRLGPRFVGEIRAGVEVVDGELADEEGVGSGHECADGDVEIIVS